MKIRLTAALLALGLATATAPALPAFAEVAVRDAQGVAHLNLDSQLVPPHGAGVYGGSLQLTISPDGIVNGYYRPDDNARFETVTGGLNGDKIWLDIGRLSNGLHVSGTLEGGVIRAETFVGTQLFDFKAQPKIQN